VFEARTGSRKAEHERKTTQRRAFETLLEQTEQIGKSSELDEAQMRRARHDLQEQWKAAVAEHGAPPAALEARFKAARSHADDAVRGKARAAEASTWQTLFAKERLCEELDAVAGDEAEPDGVVAPSVQERWAALPGLPADWEQRIAGRRDAALAALPDIDERYYYGKRIEEVAGERRDALLEIELMLGIPSPPDLQPQRLAVQVKQLRNRFKRDSDGADSAQALLLNWCALPGAADDRDRQRCEAIVRRLHRPVTR
jgi:DNA repair protein SbcC/Rad50